MPEVLTQRPQPITLRGIRLKSLSLSADAKPQGSYELISSNDKVLASQSFNGYGSMEVAFSPDTIAAEQRYRDLVTRDISMILGLPTEEVSR